MGNDQSATAHDFSLAREDPPIYRLKGTVTTTSTGWTVEIYTIPDGFVPEDELSRFLLHAVPPDSDVAVEWVMTDHPVELSFEDVPALERVFVHLQGATDGGDGTEIEVPVS